MRKEKNNNNNKKTIKKWVENERKKPEKITRKKDMFVVCVFNQSKVSGNARKKSIYLIFSFFGQIIFVSV